MDEVKLNLGAGQTYLPGFCNIDVCPWADVQLDFGTDRLPFEDSSVDCVFSHHTLEHVPDYLHILGEIHRILRHGGRLLVGLPYVTSTKYHLVNPYHLHNFNEFSFDFFRNQRAAMPPLFGAGMGPIAFDYGQRSFRIAPSLDEAEARSLITILAERLPRAVREL